jgi:phage terminase large subunit GpA-like protein
VKDESDPVWDALTNFVNTAIPYAQTLDARQMRIPISAVSIDSGDGTTARLVYKWVKKMNQANPYIFATKGDKSVGVTAREIFTVPNNPDAKTADQQRKIVAETMGVHVYLVGVQRGKDEVLRKIALDGTRDRMYHYTSARPDYEEQILSNKKRLSTAEGEIRYELTMGKRDEALDCEVLAEHAKRAIFLHLWTEKHFQQAEKSLVESVLLLANTQVQEPEQNVFPGINK